MIEAPTVLLMSIDTMNPLGTMRSMAKVMGHVHVAGAVILTDILKHPDVEAQSKEFGVKVRDHCESDQAFPIPEDNGRVSHPDYELANLIEPANQFYNGISHVLYMEADSGIVDANAWNLRFLGFDFIGAPWKEHGYSGWPRCDGKTNAVGNFGFSLRSRKFCELVSRTAKSSTDKARFCSDAWACRTMRNQFESQGIRYAPVELAERFSCEDRKYTGQFAFHGHKTMEMNGWT